MNVPTTRQLATYFKRLGIDLIAPNQEECEGWRLGGNAPFGDYSFSTRQDLWSRWLEYASFRIHEANKKEAFLSMYRQATPEKRTALKKELLHYIYCDGPQSLSDAFKMLPANTTDTLPKDWKQQIAKIVMGGDMRSFATIVAEEISQQG